jgi:hypothetical protein
VVEAGSSEDGKTKLNFFVTRKAERKRQRADNH